MEAETDKASVAGSFGDQEIYHWGLQKALTFHSKSMPSIEVCGPGTNTDWVIELQLVADSADKMKRNRGRRGLDMLNRMQSSSVVDVKVTLLDGSYHEVDSSEMAFKVAGSMAFKEAAKKANPVILEPIMAIEVVTPEEYMGDVIGDLNSRRGRIQTMDQRANVRVVAAQVPLSSMFGYATDLRSKTQGRATYTMQFDHYDEVPKNISEDIITKVRGG